jgi:hypothetical protein
MSLQNKIKPIKTKIKLKKAHVPKYITHPIIENSKVIPSLPPPVQKETAVPKAPTTLKVTPNVIPTVTPNAAIMKSNVPSNLSPKQPNVPPTITSTVPIMKPIITTPSVPTTITTTVSKTPIIPNVPIVTTSITPSVPTTITTTVSKTPIIPNVPIVTTSITPSVPTTPIVPNVPSVTTTIIPSVPTTITTPVSKTPIVPNVPIVTTSITPSVPTTITTPVKKVQPIKIDDKVGIVITTYGKNNVFAIQNIRWVRTYLPNAVIFLYMNEVIHKNSILEACTTFQVEPIIVDDQDAYGGLTGTWNRGIAKCIKNECSIIILSNDDLFINETIHHIIDEAVLSCRNKTMEYFGPLTNNPGPDNEKQLFRANANASRIISNRGLNGFFMVFPVHVLHEIKWDKTHFFDPTFPFGGNEDEWYARFHKKGGKSIIVPSTFVYHYKLRLWRKNEPVKSNICIYTVNTGNYDDHTIRCNTTYDFLYFTDDPTFIYQCIEQNIIPFLVEKSTNPKLQQRTIKICPHHYLPDIYDIAIYVDAIVIPNMTAVDAMINVILHNPINMIHVNHPCRKKITEEATVVVKSKLEHNHNVQMILDMHKKDNFKDDVGLTETALLIRKYKNIINFSEEWLKCVTICIRDQISFNYILWKHSVSSLCLDNSQKQIYNKDLHSEYTCKYKRIKGK